MIMIYLHKENTLMLFADAKNDRILLKIFKLNEC